MVYIHNGTPTLHLVFTYPPHQPLTQEFRFNSTLFQQGLPLSSNHYNCQYILQYFALVKIGKIQDWAPACSLHHQQFCCRVENFKGKLEQKKSSQNVDFEHVGWIEAGFNSSTCGLNELQSRLIITKFIWVAHCTLAPVL